MQDSDKENHLSSKAVEGFCQNVLVRFEHALQQNEISDIFYNDLGRLGEDEFSAGNNSQIVLQVGSYCFSLKNLCY